MAGTPKREQYTECEECSKIAGDPVIVHAIYVEEIHSIFEREVTYECPRGHKVTPPNAGREGNAFHDRGGQLGIAEVGELPGDCSPGHDLNEGTHLLQRLSRAQAGRQRLMQTAD